VLIDTPIFAPSAGEGAQTLFEVDYFGEPVYLAQTGQLYVEAACMAHGKVYCFGPTFRAEKSKTRRHLTEFWMVEPEIAYADLDDVIAWRRTSSAASCSACCATIVKTWRAGPRRRDAGGDPEAVRPADLHRGGRSAARPKAKNCSKTTSKEKQRPHRRTEEADR
jgi:hypothetical protein